MERMEMTRDKLKDHPNHDLLHGKLMQQKRADMMVIKPHKKMALPIGRTPGHADSPVCRSPLTPFPGSPFGFSTASGFNTHLNAEAIGRSLSCPSTPLFSPLLGTWADDTEKYFPEFQYSGSGGVNGIDMRHAPPYLDDDFPATPLSPAVDSHLCQYDATSPLAGGDDDDDDAMSNHSFFSNPHSIGKPHGQIHADLEMKDAEPKSDVFAVDTHMPQPMMEGYPEGIQHSLADLDVKCTMDTSDGGTAFLPNEMTPPLMGSPELHPARHLPPPQFLIQDEEQQQPPREMAHGLPHLSEDMPLQQELKHQSEFSAAHPFPSISSSLQDLDQENFAAAFAQTFHADSSPTNSFSMPRPNGAGDLFSTDFDHKSIQHSSPKLTSLSGMQPPSMDREFNHMQPAAQKLPGSANSSFSRTGNSGTPPVFPSPPRSGRQSTHSPPVLQVAMQTNPQPAVALGPNPGPSLFPRSGSPSANTQVSVAPHSSSAPQPFLTPAGSSAVPFGGLSKPITPGFPTPGNASLPPFASPPTIHNAKPTAVQAFSGQTAIPFANVPQTGTSALPFALNVSHMASSQQGHGASPPFATAPSSIAQAMNQAIKASQPPAKGPAATAMTFPNADRSSTPPFVMSPGRSPGFPIPSNAAANFVSEGTPLVSVGSPPFVAGPSGNLTIFVSGNGQMSLTPPGSLHTQNNAFLNASSSSTQQPRVIGTFSTPQGPEHIFTGPAPPHPAVSPAMSPGIMGSNQMITVVPHAPASSQPAVSAAIQGVRPGRNGRNGSGRHYMNECETQLTEMTIFYLKDDSINPYRGSVPVERIQNVVRSKHADLYNTVVGTRHNSWRRYVERHPDVFHLFSVEDGKWRMRLVQHENWEEGDRQEQEERQSKEQHLIACLSSFLGQRGATCKVDEFMDAYPTLPQNQNAGLDEDCLHPLPARGDLVRFVRRHSSHFIYDAETLSMGLKQEPS